MTGESHAILYRVVHGDPDIAAVPEPLRPLVAATLAKDPERRPTAQQVPVDHGAQTSISGVSFDRAGLIAVRPGRAASGAADGVAYFSPNGLAWHYAGTIDAAGGWSPAVVKGSDYGFVVTGTTAKNQYVAYTSTGTGGTWLPTGSLGDSSTTSKPPARSGRERPSSPSVRQRHQDRPAGIVRQGGHGG